MRSAWSAAALGGLSSERGDLSEILYALMFRLLSRGDCNPWLFLSLIQSAQAVFSFNNPSAFCTSCDMTIKLLPKSRTKIIVGRL